MPTLETSRSELHALVWSKPTRDCAEQLGMSDTGLAKLCRRNDVVRPPNGYWLRSIKRKVPPALKGKDKRITAYLRDPVPKPEKVAIDVPEVLAGGRSHKEVSRCRSELRGAKPDTYGRLVSKRTDIQVSRKTLPRALSLMNVIIRTALKLDCRVGTPENNIQLIRDDVSVGLFFFESSTRARGKVKHGNYEYNELIYTPSGKLKLSLLGVYGIGCQREWNDRPDKPLESQVESIIHGILRALDGLVLYRIDQEKLARQYEIQHRLNKRRALASKLARERQSRVDRLIDNWQRSQDIVRVMDAIDAQGTAPSAKDRRLIRWARELARHYDPVDVHTIDALNDG